MCELAYFGRGNVAVFLVVVLVVVVLVVVLCATAAQQDFNLPFKSCLGQGISWISGDEAAELLPSHRVQPCSTVATGTLPNPLSVLRKTLESASCPSWLHDLVARSWALLCLLRNCLYNVDIKRESTIYLCIVILQYIIELVTHAHTSRHTHRHTHDAQTHRTHAARQNYYANSKWKRIEEKLIYLFHSSNKSIVFQFDSISAQLIFVLGFSVLPFVRFRLSLCRCFFCF